MTGTRFSRPVTDAERLLSLLRTDKEIEAICRRRSKTVCRICFAYLKSARDAEDALYLYGTEQSIANAPYWLTKIE